MTTTAGDRFGVARRLLTVVLCFLAVGGCTSMSGDLADLESRVTDLGFRDVVAWQRDENDRTIVTVEAYTTVPRAYERSDIEKIAEVVWDTYPHEFDVVELALNGYLADTLPADDLLDLFGPRAVQPTSSTDSGIVAVIVTLSVFVLLMGLIVTFLVLALRRLERKRREHASQYGAPPYPGYWWPPHQ
ncbi:MAG TPA: hypothetical protein VFM37_12985 [Pseudonocardiaceae bacterium]|nr:hypothetical protein [Pseudonocardiaceae bacterium]